MLEGLATLVAAYVALVAALVVYTRRHRDVLSLREAVRLLPDVLRLTRRLAGDRTVPRLVRLELVLLLGYLALPFDVVPDFVPVLGYADDVVALALVLRSVVRRAGVDAVRSHWPGSPEGLALVLRLAGLAQGSDV